MDANDVGQKLHIINRNNDGILSKFDYQISFMYQLGLAKIALWTSNGIQLHVMPLFPVYFSHILTKLPTHKCVISRLCLQCENIKVFKEANTINSF